MLVWCSILMNLCRTLSTDKSCVFIVEFLQLIKDHLSQRWRRVALRKTKKRGGKKNQYTPFRLSAMHYFRYYPENKTVLTDEIILYLPKIFCLVLLICQKPSNKHKQHQILVGHTPTSKASKRCKEKKLLWLEFTTVKPLINTLHAERDASIDRPHFTRLPLNER